MTELEHLQWYKGNTEMNNSNAQDGPFGQLDLFSDVIIDVINMIPTFNSFKPTYI